MTKKYLFLPLLFVLLTQRVCAVEGAEWGNFSATDNQILLAKEITNSLEKGHFVKKDYESVRLEAFEVFIKRLDPNRNIFISSDLDTFWKQVESTNEIGSDLKEAYLLFDIYRERYQLRHYFQLEILNTISKEDLQTSYNILRDRSESERLERLLDLKSLWKNLIINDVIQLMLSGNSLEDSVDKLSKRLDNQLNYFQQTRNEDVFDIYVNSVSSTYGPHTTYMSPRNNEDFDISMSLSLEGIGALLSSDGLYTSITSLVPGGPAEKSGLLKPKDKIIGVGQDDNKPLTDVIGWRIDDVVDLIRGPKDSTVRLQIIPNSSLDETNTREIEIVRNLVKLEDQAAEKELITVNRGNKDYKIGVIKLPAFYFDFEAYQQRDYTYRSSSKDVKKLLKELKNEDVDGLVLDLRNNGGGSLFEANALAHFFLGRGTTVQIKDSKGNIQGLGERWGYPFYDKPLLVLVNRLSASASEILAGAIQDYDRGVIAGTKTFGKGTVQKVEELSSGVIKLTESKFYRVSGSSTQNKGVVPDIILPSVFDIEDIGENKLDKALEHDSIQTTSYKNFGRISSYKDLLNNRSKARINKSPLFTNLKEKKEWRKKSEIKLLELNLNNRIQKKIELEHSLLTAENILRERLLLPTFDSYQEFLDRNEDPEILDINLNVLNEAANVLTDLIEIKNKPLIAYLDKTG